MMLSHEYGHVLKISANQLNGLIHKSLATIVSVNSQNRPSEINQM